MNSHIAFTTPYVRGADSDDPVVASRLDLQVQAQLVSSESKSPVRRRHWRQKTGWPATCTTATGFSWECWVIDHSIGGLGLCHCPELGVGQVVQINLHEIGVFRCRIAWSEQSRCGMQFIDDPNHASMEEMETMVRLLPNASDHQSTKAAADSSGSVTERSWLFRWLTRNTHQRSPSELPADALFNGGAAAPQSERLSN